MYVKISKINMFKMDAWTFCSHLWSCYGLYIVPNCIRNHHFEFEIDRTLLINLLSKLMKRPNCHGRTDRRTDINCIEANLLPKKPFVNY